MKKPKLNINFGEGGFQGWIMRHCEKIILGVIACLALWVIWGGYSLSGLGSDNSPDKLRAAAQDKQTVIKTARWDVFKKDRDVAGGALDKVDKIPAINPGLYLFPHGFDPDDFPKLTKRTDPTVFEPINLKTVPIVTSLAYVHDGEADPLDQSPADGGKPGRRPAAAPPKPRVAAAAPGAAGGVPIPGAASAKGGKRTKGGPMGNSPTGDGMDLLGEAPAALEGGTMDGMGPGADMPGMPGGGGAAAQAVSGEYRPPGNAIAKSKNAVVVMAIVQHQRQYDEYQKTFKDALDPDGARDQPTYLTFFVQRVDVTDNPQIDPATIPEETWQKGQLKAGDMLKDAAKWSGFPPDILDPNYLIPVDPFVPPRSRMGLTHPLPPFVQRDLWEVRTHPDIPLASAAMRMPLRGSTEEMEPGEESGDEVPGVPTARGGVRSGGMRPGGMMSGGAMPGGGMTGGAMPGLSPDDIGSGPGAAMPGMAGMGMPGMGAGMPGMGGGMAGMPGMGSGMAGMGGFGGSSAAPNTPLVKYKLIRFTDFTVEPGRKYRYRVCVVLDDPNNTGMHAAPKPASLDQTVVDRLKTDEKKTYRQSKWSVPSEVVTLPPLHWFFAGKVAPERADVIVENTRPVRMAEPSATVLAIVHDPEKGADIPTEQDKVYRGFTFNLKTEVEVVHPIKSEYRTLKDYILRTNAVVADIFGGEAMPTINKDRKEKLTIPGELLIVDADGNLLVQDESEDVESFHRFAPPKEETKAATAGAGEGALIPMPGGGPGEESGPGEAPMGGKRGRKGM